MALRDKYPLHPRKVIKKTITESIGYLWVVGILAAIASSLVGSWLPMICLFLVPVAVYLWQMEYYRVYFYDSSEHGLEIKKGVFFPNSITIPNEKVSDVYVDQDLLDQLFGLYDLHFASASMSSGNLAHIDGLDKQATESLKSYLLSSLGSNMPGAGALQGGQPAAPLPQQAIATFKPSSVGLWLDFAGALFGFALFSLFVFPPLLVAIPFLAIPIGLYVKKDYGTRIYVLRQDGLWLREGWLMPHETLLFYKNIQDLDVNQDIFERYFGLFTIRVKSMSYLSAMSARLRLLSSSDSASMQEILRRQIELAREAEAAAKAKSMPPSGAFASKPAPSPAPVHSGEQISNPFKNRFMLGRALGSLLIVLALLALATFVLIAAVAFSGYVRIFTGAGAVLLYVLAGALVAIAAGLFILSLATGFVDSATYSYALGREGLIVEFGLIGRIKKVIRYEKVQDIRLASGFVESFARLATLNVETGSRDIALQGDSSGSAAAQKAFEQMAESIPFLSYADANAFRSKLLEIVGLSYPKNAVPLRLSIPLSSSKPLKKTVAYIGIFKAQLFIVLLLAALVSSPPASYLALAGCAILFLYFLSAIIVYLYEQVYMKKYFYDENGESLVIRKGVFGWAEIIVPFKNIQTIYIDQDWYDSFFGLWDVWITTVTDESGPMAHIDGVSRQDAERLARLLAKRVEESRKK
ncbi:MAG: PH domain-containing protein [Candidatus Micrarchaeia archaeon]